MYIPEGICNFVPVAPFAGAWIEILKDLNQSLNEGLVAPFAGAWIEIYSSRVLTNTHLSLPSRERGLKYRLGQEAFESQIVAPFAGAWIEIKSPASFGNPHRASLPSRKRGLKSNISNEWLDFIALCRSGKTHNYDIVEEPMANDTVWNYVNDFLAGRINRKQFWALAEFKYPTHQISFHTLSAIDCLKYVKSEVIYD